MSDNNCKCEEPFQRPTNVPPCCRLPKPSSAVLLKNSKWRDIDTLNVHFLEGRNSQKRFVRNVINRDIVPHIGLKINFDAPANESPVRIGFDTDLGSWSYVGTEAIFYAPRPWQTTLNLGWLDSQVIVHEFLHALGFAHEMGNPFGEPIQWNKDAVYEDLGGPPNYWDKETINFNVFEQYDPDNIDATDFDKDSIMLYPIPNTWTLNDFSVGFNTQMSPLDIQKLQESYPLSAYPPSDDDDTTTSKKGCCVGFLKQIFRTSRSLQQLRVWTVRNMANALGGDFNRESDREQMQNFIISKMEF